MLAWRTDHAYTQANLFKKRSVGDRVKGTPAANALSSAFPPFFILFFFSLGGVTPTYPDSMIARAIRPFAIGDSSRLQVLRPPAETPKTVTFSGKPPKLSMLRLPRREAPEADAR